MIEMICASSLLFDCIGYSTQSVSRQRYEVYTTIRPRARNGEGGIFRSRNAGPFGLATARTRILESSVNFTRVGHGWRRMLHPEGRQRRPQDSEFDGDWAPADANHSHR